MGNKKSSKDILKQRKVRKTAKPARAKKMVCHKPKFLVLSVKESDAKIENIAIRKVATNRLPIMFGGFNFNNNKFKILKNPAAAVALLLFVVLASFFVSPQYKAKPAPEVKAAAIKKTSEIITGNPVAWTALVRRSDINLNHYLLKLPKSASNIKITIVSAKQAENILSAKPKQELSLKQRQQIAIATSNSVGKQVKTPLSHKASEGQAKSFFARITTFLLAGLSDAVSRTTVTTTQAEDTGTALTTDSTLVDLSAQAPQPSPPPSPDATAEQSDFVKVDYETPAPVITEQATDTGKLVTVSAPTETPDQPQLTDVLASTKIPRLFKVGQESKIHIKWKNPSTSSGQAIAGEQEMVFKAYDTDKDGYLDYVEWTVPHLSTQIFDIIFISKAFQLDASQNITADIYDTVAHQDNVWANVPSGNYVRFTFESQLNNTKNIDIYAKPSAPSSDGAIAVAVEVYPVYTDADGNQTEGPLVAVFPTIDHADTYHANLANLSTNTDIFDFKIINASVDLDYVQDAGAVTLTINNSATTCTGGPDWTTSASCNVNITDIQNDLNAGTSVSFTATGDGSGAHIVVSNAFSKTAGGDATVSMYAGDSGSGNITVNAAISSTVGKLNMLFNADRGAVSSGYINIGAAITSNGGNITMGGGSGTISAGSGFAVGNSGQVRGVLINNVTVAAGGGNIIVNGQGYNTTTDGNNGVLVTGASGAFTTTGAGTINVTGNGAGNTSSGANSGVFMTSASVISTVSGALTVSGTGGGVNSAGYSNSGVTLTWGSSITSSGGVITITGNGGGGSNSDQNQGVHIGGGSSGVISNTGSGVINITANGGGGGGTNSGWDYGLYIGLGGVISTVNGNLTVSATGGGAGSRTNNYGVYVESTGTIKTTGSGNLSVTGIRGGGATASNYGVYLAVANSLQTTSTGAITVTADTIFLTEANDINSVGNLTIKPYTATSTVGIGAGAGTLALTDTYLGYLTWGASSILTIGSATAGNITINTASALLDSRVAFLTGGSYDVQAGTIGAVLGGTGVALTKSTAGTVTLSGANTFTGGVTLNSGQLNINNASALGTVAGTFTINGGTIDNTSAGSISTLNYPIALNGDFTWAGSTKSLYFGTGAITPNASRTITCNNAGVWLGFNGVIGGGAINLTKAGAGTLILYGASTYTGTTTVLAGTLIAGTNTLSGLAGAFGNATSDILLGNTTGSDSASLVILGAYTVGRNITVQSGSSGTAYIYSRNDSAIFSGNITLNKDVSLRSNNASYTTTFSGIISGGYNVNIVSNNPGTVTLSNANTYTGTTTISAGTLQVGNANALGTGSVAISGGTLVANNDFNVGGSWTYTSGGWTHNNHTVTFTSTALGNTITTGAQAFYGLTMNGTGGAWTLQDNLTATFGWFHAHLHRFVDTGGEWEYKQFKFQ
ncbi:MAG: autotransporter-associated beta strand repeat-containing protein [Candidatus Staskawiczbacteria bacterium]|nr:autotransporter-associated beta strand repeat-containing protein [Candidatus Staskawiczbacteria bacterium]